MNDITTTSADWETAELLPTIRHMCADGATDPEFKILVATARLLGLNPMLKQIWCVKNKNRPEDPAQIYASRDGLIAIAHRSGQFDGMQSGTRKNEEGQEIGWCRIWRKDMSHPFEAEILRSEYDLKRNLWLSKPQTMTAKVAEAHCLRKAFDICGVYTPDEMPEPDGPRVIADTSRTVSAIAEPKPKPEAATRIAGGAGSPVECGRCGATVDESPTLRIVERDGVYVCEDCLRAAMPKKAMGEAQVTHVVEPAPAPKAVPKPPAKVPKPSADPVAVCEECGANVTEPQRKTSMLFASRVLCSKCVDAVGAAGDEARA